MQIIKHLYYYSKGTIYALIAVFIWADFELGKVLTTHVNINDLEVAKTQFSTRLIVLTIVIAVIESMENFTKMWNRNK